MEGDRGVYFPRSVMLWQLQRRLQNKVLRLEGGLSSQVPFEDIEGEVQVGAARTSSRLRFGRTVWALALACLSDYRRMTVCVFQKRRSKFAGLLC